MPSAKKWNEHGHLTTSAYQARRRALLQRLAPDRRCHHCRKLAPSWQALEFDHLDGRDYHLNVANRDGRLRIYEREVAAGVRVVASCRKCNAVDGAHRSRWGKKRRSPLIRGTYADHVYAQWERAWLRMWYEVGLTFAQSVATDAA